MRRVADKTPWFLFLVSCSVASAVSAVTASACPAADSSPLADIGPAPETVLIDSSGRPFDLAHLRGKVVLVGFIYTTCSGVCPATTHRMYRVQEALKKDGLWGDRVAFVSISLDPERDTPEVLERYAGIYTADRAAWHFLTGPNEQVEAVVAAWDMWARIGPEGVLDHPSRLFLIDPNGRQREIYNLEFLTPDRVIEDIRSILEEAEGPPPNPPRPPGTE